MSLSSEWNNENGAEYENLLCAALLHDIGKFYQRSGFEREKHTKVSGAFVNFFTSSFNNPELINILVQHHHESQSFTGSLPKELTNERERVLAYLISRADNFSSKERTDEFEGGGYKPDATLHSIFSAIQISDNTDAVTSQYSYKLGRYLQGDMFAAVNNTISQLDYENHVKQFCNEFAELFPKPYPGMSDTLLHLIRKYLWCVPSDTTKKVRDISLADHMQTTCTLAACMYKYHEYNGWAEKDVKDNDLPRFILMGGDISGIQDYIYGIASIGHGGVAKRLRGRSFKIALLTEMCAANILARLNLPMACKIMSAGGQFYILLPNTPAVIDAIPALRKEINSYLLNKYRGALSISIAYNDLPADALIQESFHVILDKVKLKLEHEKKRKFNDVLSAGTKLFDVEYKGEGLCPVCNHNPAESDLLVCDDCDEDATLGRLLPECKYLAISKTRNNDNADIRILQYSIKLLKDTPGDKNNIFVWNIKPVLPVENGIEIKNGDKVYRMMPGQPSGFAPFAGYIPVWRDVEKEKLTEYRDSIKSTIIDGEENDELDQARIGMVKSFRALANAGDGAPRIGVLRADVDNLGLIFSIGMIGNSSLSRIATLSNMLQAFFSGVLPRIIKENYPNLYIAYAGGDDLMIVGPWQDTIKFSADMRKNFSAYTCNNQTFTISAGIGIFNHHAPVAITAPLSGEMLDNAKNAGRNRLSVFDTIIEWSQYTVFADWAELLTDELLDEKSKMSPSFLYRLLGYQRRALKWYEEKDNKAILYRPHLAYDLGRNYTKADGTSHLNPKLHEKLSSLLGSETENIWRFLAAPINWAALATRGRRNSK